MIGPVVGSLVYNAIGFEGVFFTFGAAMIPFAILICCMLPEINKLGQKNVQGDVEGKVEVENTDDEIPLKKVTYM